MAVNCPARLVLTTVSSAADADRIAAQLVDSGLAACVSRVPGVISTYRWQDAVVTDEEVLLLLKTHEARLDELVERLTIEHPYDVPEIAVLEIADGAKGWLDWLRTATADLK